MLTALAHFFEVCATALSISGDLIVVWMAREAKKRTKLPPQSSAESGVRTLTALAFVLYASSTSQYGLLVAYASSAVSLMLLSAAQLRTIRLFEKAGITTSMSYQTACTTATVIFAVAILLYVIMTFLYNDPSRGPLVSGVSSVLFSGVSIFPLLARSVWPSSDLEPVQGDTLVHVFKGACAVMWIVYSLVISDTFVLGGHCLVLISCLLGLAVVGFHLQLPCLVPRRVRESLWGTEPPYEQTLEDKASVISSAYYCWVARFATSAAKESLALSDMPRPMKDHRTWNSATNLCSQMQEELKRLHSWDALVHVAQVRAQWDSNSIGTLRWVGIMQRSPNPDSVMAGVEWKTKPCEPPRGSGIVLEYHNGQFEGETLFYQQNSSDDSVAKDKWSNQQNSCCIPVEQVDILNDDGSLMIPDAPVIPSVTRALFASTWDSIWIQAPFRVIADICMLSSPLILEAFVKFLKSTAPNAAVGLGLVLAVFLIGLTQSSLLHRYYHLSIRSGIIQRNALLGALFEKCFLISAKEMANPEMGTGRVVNMISSDAERFNDFQQMLLFFWSYPFQVVCGIALLYRLVGWCAIGSILALSLAIPLQQRVAELQYKYRQLLVSQSDQRIKLTNELFSGIRIVKFMGWEFNFMSRLNERRKAELGFLKKTQYCRVLSALVTAATPTVLVATVFILYHLSGHDLTPEVVFPTIAVLNLMRIPFIQIPTLFTTYIQFSVAASRISKFLMCDNQRENTVEDLEKYLTRTSNEVAAAQKATQLAAVFEGATISASLPLKLSIVERDVDDSSFNAAVRRSFCCSEPPRVHVSTKGKDSYALTTKALLSNVTLQIPRGKLTVIVGPTGSGKSTLLESLLGQLEVSCGTIAIRGSIAYVPQQPWIMNATVRDNILFFSSEVEDRLHHSIRVCQLEPDLLTLTAGLETEIGEKGVNLSGGQRARVSMARAVYADSDIYLLDDPLSALDAHVGASLMEHCILGSLRSKTRVLATHHVHVLRQADYIIELKPNGEVAFCGTSSEYHIDEEKCPDQKTPTEVTEGEAHSEHSPASPSPTLITGKLMSTEEKASGSVPLATYQKYFDACGGLMKCLFVLLVFLVTEFLIVANTVWLSLWSVRTFSLSQNGYMCVYLVIISIGIVSAPLRYRCAYDVMRAASLSLHNHLLTSVVKAPMSFFDTTPLGRILNRFVQDIDQTDNGLQMSVVSLLQMGFSATSTAIIMLSSQPVAIFVLIPCCAVYYKLLVFYNAANRESRRLSNIVKSPVFSLLTEVLNGSKTVRAYQKSNCIMAEAMKRLDVTYSAAYLQNVLNRWLGVRIEFLGNVIVSTVALATTLGKIYSLGTSNVAILALGLTMSTTITTLLNWMVRQLSSVESDMNSIERIIHYTESIDQEDIEFSPHIKEPIDLPSSIEFSNVMMQYRPGLPYVLNNLSFSVDPGEKVGVVGRTGSGKSSLLLTFLRIVDISAGNILIGGRSIRDLSLVQLRQLFSMIPQDPILFDGTVRSNLDPFSQHCDEDIWQALSLVGLREKISSEILGLNSLILDGGSNFSVGQRQLLCMARAILKKGCKFILMDEATANIDPTLDRLIQHAVKTAFSGRTVVTIAHRLHTIAAYDKIVFMEKGAAVEVGPPSVLYKLGSRFKEMVDAQQPAARDEVLEILFRTQRGE